MWFFFLSSGQQQRQAQNITFILCLPLFDSQSRRRGAASKAKSEAYLVCAPILNIFVPQWEQVPWVAGLPFFIVTGVGSFISFLALHLTQYASIVRPPFD